ncbi:cytochrome b5 [Epithele typhae]|uniref:cytochrome b5 n=1 Tax=Epithele typhae TaxID=378194 RepID=UPI002008CEE7|nr:cytochrome b5 [Epithele typhae]KAH9943005.1 cytochrome b5 [Epithele typhae]
MSWILNPEGDRQQRRRPEKLKAQDGAAGPDAQAESAPGSPWAEFPLKDEYPTVEDPSVPGRQVSTKQANRPFLAYAKYRQERQQAHDDWVKRMEERKEKIARGEDVGPEEPDPTAEVEVGCSGVLKFMLYALIFAVLAGKFFTGSYLWELDPPSLRQYLPSTDRLFSESVLATYDGTDPEKPIYLAIDGVVYDVSAGRATYGPGGSYHLMAGTDAARAYGTGCFKTHRTHDLRGLTESEMRGVEHWKKFYAESKKYARVGRVSHLAIDPASPVPEHCTPKKAEAAKDAAAGAGKDGNGNRAHGEL